MCTLPNCEIKNKGELGMTYEEAYAKRDKALGHWNRQWSGARDLYGCPYPQALLVGSNGQLAITHNGKEIYSVPFLEGSEA